MTRSSLMYNNLCLRKCSGQVTHTAGMIQVNMCNHDCCQVGRADPQIS